MSILSPGAVIGMVGGGQLGRMSAMAAARLGYSVHVLSPEAGGPAAQVSARQTVAAYDDRDALARFAAEVDVITFEFENVPAGLYENLPVPVRPGPGILAIAQDRVAEKRFLNEAGIATAPWRGVDSPDELKAAAAAIGLPAILKTTRLGYDGKGQALLRTGEDVETAFAGLTPKPLILEGFVDFACELSVMVARGVGGDVVTFDTVENRHKHHILDLTLAPAPVQPETRRAAAEIATRIATALDLVGIIGVEFFLAATGALIVNEIAPRPHNSGHWTLDACAHSQFDLHIRAIAGLPLPPTTRHSDAAMKNLVGPDDMAHWPQILSTPSLIPHHYGKTEARPGRKMAHVTTLFPKHALPGDAGIAAALGWGK
jgi:5-(carboxyamino)imidazole ribonucleotide synthase